MPVKCKGCDETFTYTKAQGLKRPPRYCTLRCYNTNGGGLEKLREGFQRRKEVVKPCKHCGADVRSLATQDPSCRVCTIQRHVDKKRRRRAVQAGLPTEPYTRDEIAERDGYECGICREPVDMGVKFPDSQAPSIDHIVPIKAGGGDTPDNVQLAHFGCNSRKGARV